MEAIIRTLLLEGIDEATIHRVLDVIEEGRLWDENQNRPKALVRDVAKKQIKVQKSNMAKQTDIMNKTGDIKDPNNLKTYVNASKNFTKASRNLSTAKRISNRSDVQVSHD